ncbi:deoxyribonuclease IV [Candidatus Fermentibacteria bacterium]|nr:MAG: deoxyribonuclease IV [Candidatus Fermentibacteria bacterium]
MIPGIHVSVNGGLDKALDTLTGLGLPCGQIFTSNQQQWKGRTVKEREIEKYSNRSVTIISHTSYLINLASTSERVVKLSVPALKAELQRIHILGIEWCVLHPGAHLGAGEDEGIRKISSMVRDILQGSSPDTGILYENTAGQGTTLGYTFEQLAELLELTDMPDRTGICFDTCHAFAAGYDLSSEFAVRETMSKFSDTVGIEKIRAFHINDSKGECGSRKDRHASIGEGLIGLAPLRFLASMPEFREIPGIAETPGSDSDRAQDIEKVVNQ